MSTLQTTIPFTHKKVVSRIASKCEEKENAYCENKSGSPCKSLLRENCENVVSIREVNGEKNLKRFSSEDVYVGSSPPKQKYSTKTCSNEAIKALHSASPSKLPGREDKINEILLIFNECLDTKKSATIYMSGPPGTGKTACINHIVQLPKVAKGFKTVVINCTGIKSSGAVYHRVSDELNLKLKNKTEKSIQTAIHNHLISEHRMILLILDEIDQLESKRQSILYSIFEWPLLPDSKIVLVGIANALDLTDRVLPRLKAKINFQPIVIPFTPYSKEQIANILSERLTEVGVERILTGGALQLLASKLAAISGDIRRALDLARRVVELAEQKVEDGKSVSLHEVLDVVNNVYTTSTSLSFGTIEAFPIQQKLLVCTALLVRRQSKSKELSLGKLHDIYRKVCNKRNFGMLGLSEFISLTQLVESRGVIKIQGKTANRLSKITLLWDESEAAAALKDKELLASILTDTSCL